MSDQPKQGPGAIVWTDLTVENAVEVKDFYQSVVGWEASGTDMGGYEDFNMQIPGGKVVTGICHARGANANIPPQWIIYLTVDNLDESLAKTEAGGGKLLSGPTAYGPGRYAIIQDPAGAAVALFQGGEQGSE